MKKIQFTTLGLVSALLVTSCGSKELTKKEFIENVIKNMANQVPNFKNGTAKAKLSDYKFSCSSEENKTFYKEFYEATIYSVLRVFDFKIDDNFDFTKGYESTIELNEKDIKQLIDERPTSYAYEVTLKEDTTRFIKNGNDLTYITLTSDETGNFEASTTINEYNLMTYKESKIHYMVEEKDNNIELEYRLTFEYTFKS